jgi:hypothetical protein
MTKNAMTIAAATMSLAAGTCLGLTTAAGDEPTPGPTTVTLKSKVDPTAFVVHRKNPRSRRFKAGDVITFAAALVKDEKPYGRLEGVQVAFDPHYGGISMHYTLLLPDGNIEVLGAAVNERVPGLVKPTDTDPAAIVGGTGAYEGAHGTFVLRTARGGDLVVLTYTK